MGRAPCCDKANVKKGPWSPEEDATLKEYIDKFGTGGNWIALPQKAGLRRCGKSCRLRWLNYLRPNIKHGEFSDEEDRIICNLFTNIGSRWSIIAAQLPGRTDNDIKNYWNTKLKKKLMDMTILHQSQLKSHHQSATISSLLLQTSPSPSSYRGSNNNTSYYTQSQSQSFASSLEPISFSHSLMSTSCSANNAANSALQLSQESFVGRPLLHFQGTDNILMFGSEASCSSSDGSHEYGGYGGGRGGGSGGGMQTYSGLNGGGVNGWRDDQDQAPLVDYGLEEIKQLISSTSSCNNYLFDENKTEEKAMVYY